MGRGGGSSSSGRGFSGGSPGRGFSGGWGSGSSSPLGRGGGGLGGLGSGLGGGRNGGGGLGGLGGLGTLAGLGALRGLGRSMRDSYYENHGGGYRRNGYGGGGGGCGCSSLIGIIVFIFFMLIIISFFFGCSKVSTNVSDSQNIVNKEKLSSSVLKKSNYWIEDNANWLDRENTVKNAMEHFLDKTGVQPYLIIDTNVNGNRNFSDDDVKNYLESKYNNLFQDEAHMIFVFLEPYENNYYRALYSGIAANIIIDENAQKIIYDIVDTNYTSNLSDDEYFSKIFNESADKIMAKVTTANDVKNTKVKTLGIILVVIIIGAVAVKVSKNKAKEKEEARKILDKEF